MGVSGYGSGECLLQALLKLGASTSRTLEYSSCFQKERLPHIPLGRVRGLDPYPGNATIPAWRWHTPVQGGTKVCTFR